MVIIIIMCRWIKFSAPIVVLIVPWWIWCDWNQDCMYCITFQPILQWSQTVIFLSHSNHSSESNINCCFHIHHLLVVIHRHDQKCYHDLGLIELHSLVRDTYAPLVYGTSILLMYNGLVHTPCIGVFLSA